MVDLAEAGAFDHARTAVPWTIVAGTAVGLYRFLDRNPLVEQRPVEQVHTAAMADIPRLVAVNGAVQVNLGG